MFSYKMTDDTTVCHIIIISGIVVVIGVLLFGINRILRQISKKCGSYQPPHPTPSYAGYSKDLHSGDNLLTKVELNHTPYHVAGVVEVELHYSGVPPDTTPVIVKTDKGIVINPLAIRCEGCPSLSGSPNSQVYLLGIPAMERLLLIANGPRIYGEELTVEWNGMTGMFVVPFLRADAP